MTAEPRDVAWISRVLTRIAVNEALRTPFAPCTARTVVTLGLADPAVLRCGLLEDHDGLHRFHVEWGPDAAVEAEQTLAPESERMRDGGDPMTEARLAAADRENAELRGEVERLGESQFAVGQALVNEQLRSERAESQLAAAQAQLVGKLLERDVLRALFDSPEAVEAVAAAICPGDYCEAHSECRDCARAALVALADIADGPELAALSAATQPEPERVEPDTPLGRLFDYLAQPEPPASDEPARNRCTCDRAKEGAAYHHPTCPSHIGDEPARCEHDFHATNRAGERIGLRLAGAGSSERCPAASGTPDGGS